MNITKLKQKKSKQNTNFLCSGFGLSGHTAKLGKYVRMG